MLNFAARKRELLHQGQPHIRGLGDTEIDSPHDDRIPFLLVLSITFIFTFHYTLFAEPVALMNDQVADTSQRERSRSPRRGRSRSPVRSGGRRRSYSRSRSPSRDRDDYRRSNRRSSRSPMTGAGAPSGGSGQGFGGPPQRSYEERQAAREQMMSNIRDTSQQDRRVYVGNLSYDVKWHHLKDFMRQGASNLRPRALRWKDG